MMPVHPGEQTQPLLSLLHLPPFIQSSQLKLQSLPKVLSRQTERKKCRRLGEHPDKIFPWDLTYPYRCTSTKRNTYHIDDLKKNLFRLLPFMLIALQISLSHSRRWSRMDIPKFLTLNCKVWTKGNLGLHLEFTPLVLWFPFKKHLKLLFKIKIVKLQ